MIYFVSNLQPWESGKNTNAKSCCWNQRAYLMICIVLYWYIIYQTSKSKHLKWKISLNSHFVTQISTHNLFSRKLCFHEKRKKKWKWAHFISPLKSMKWNFKIGYSNMCVIHIYTLHWYRLYTHKFHYWATLLSQIYPHFSQQYGYILYHFVTKELI